MLLPWGHHSVCCAQVMTCRADLRDAKSYKRRQRICDVHYKIGSVVRDDQLMRFCRMCECFQPLGDFEGDRRHAESDT